MNCKKDDSAKNLDAEASAETYKIADVNAAAAQETFICENLETLQTDNAPAQPAKKEQYPKFTTSHIGKYISALEKQCGKPVELHEIAVPDLARSAVDELIRYKALNAAYSFAGIVPKSLRSEDAIEMILSSIRNYEGTVLRETIEDRAIKKIYISTHFAQHDIDSVREILRSDLPADRQKSVMKKMMENAMSKNYGIWIETEEMQK